LLDDQIIDDDSVVKGKKNEEFLEEVCESSLPGGCSKTDLISLDPEYINSEHWEKYEKMEMAPSSRVQRNLDHAIPRICNNKEAKVKWKKVEESTGIPWWIVASIHYREANLDFNRYLHNGDVLCTPTTHVPIGKNYCNWDEAAVDAVQIHLEDFEEDLFLGVEKYNGPGYDLRGDESPYLWSGSTYYSKGRFVGDGTYDPNDVDYRPGVMVLAKRMEEVGCI
jgi:lysozyme family protein